MCESETGLEGESGERRRLEGGRERERVDGELGEARRMEVVGPGREEMKETKGEVVGGGEGRGGG